MNALDSNNNLRNIGKAYCLVNTPAGTMSLEIVDISGAIFDYFNMNFGVRPVVSLKSTVTISSSNTGDGSSSSSAWQLSTN